MIFLALELPCVKVLLLLDYKNNFGEGGYLVFSTDVSVNRSVTTITLPHSFRSSLSLTFIFHLLLANFQSFGRMHTRWCVSLRLHEIS